MKTPFLCRVGIHAHVVECTDNIGTAMACTLCKRNRYKPRWGYLQGHIFTVKTLLKDWNRLPLFERSIVEYAAMQKTKAIVAVTSVSVWCLLYSLIVFT